MTTSNSNKKGKTIWSKITVDHFVDTIVDLGERADELKAETWRLNVKTRSPGSLWGEIINKLKLDHNEGTRHALYDVWHSDRHIVHKLIERKRRINDAAENDSDNNHFDESEIVSVPEKSELALLPKPSLPIPSRPNTRTNKKENVDDAKIEREFIMEVSLVLSCSEWMSAFSQTDQKMKPEWTNIFDRKLTPSVVQCTLKFRTPYIKKGKRKGACRFFGCYALCTIGECTRLYKIILQKQPDQNSSALFLVRIFGQENHNLSIEGS